MFFVCVEYNFYTEHQIMKESFCVYSKSGPRLGGKNRFIFVNLLLCLRILLYSGM